MTDPEELSLLAEHPYLVNNVDTLRRIAVIQLGIWTIHGECWRSEGLGCGRLGIDGMMHVASEGKGKYQVMQKLEGRLDDFERASYLSASFTGQIPREEPTFGCRTRLPRLSTSSLIRAPAP